MNDLDSFCFICQAQLHRFMTTPIVEIENGKFEQCCEICADREFPGWDIEEQDDLLDLLSDEN